MADLPSLRAQPLACQFRATLFDSKPYPAMKEISGWLAAAMEAALNSLPTIGAGGVQVSRDQVFGGISEVPCAPCACDHRRKPTVCRSPGRRPLLLPLS